MLGNSVGLVHEYNAKDQTTKAVAPVGRSANVIEYNGPSQVERVKADGTTFKFSRLGMRRRNPAPDTTQPVYFTRDEQGRLIGARRTGASDYYYLFDGLGSVVGLVDESGNLVRSYSYDPFGNIRTDTGTGPEDFFRFAGGHHAEGGLYHFGMRYYKPGLGRWTQQDAINTPGDLRQANRYVYSANNPTSFTDTSGTHVTFPRFDLPDIDLPDFSTTRKVVTRGALIGAECYAGKTAVDEAMPLPGRIGSRFIRRSTIGWGGCVLGASTAELLGINAVATK